MQDTSAFVTAQRATSQCRSKPATSQRRSEPDWSDEGHQEEEAGSQTAGHHVAAAHGKRPEKRGGRVTEQGLRKVAAAI